MSAINDLQSLARTLGDAPVDAEAPRAYERQYALGILVFAPPAALFDFLDERAGDTARARPAAELDALAPYRRPSRDVLDRHFLRDEIVTQYEPGRLKSWESMGHQHFLLGRYRKGFRLEDRGDQALLTVFISYALPAGGLRRAIAEKFAARYARWLARRIVEAAVTWADAQDLRGELQQSPQRMTA